MGHFADKDESKIDKKCILKLQIYFTYKTINLFTIYPLEIPYNF